jgi:hypothetical protein
VSAEGRQLPQTWIFPVQTVPVEWAAVVATSGGNSTGNPSGRQTGGTFEHWVDTVFIPHAAPLREPPEHVILILDAASTHARLSALKKLKEANVHVLCLPAGTSHVLQPLDRFPFARFKKSLREGPVETKVIDWLVDVVSAAQSAFTIKNIRGSFRLCGIEPRNSSLIMQDACVVPRERMLGRTKRIRVAGRILTSGEFMQEMEVRDGGIEASK